MAELREVTSQEEMIPEDVPEIYANSINVIVTTFDVLVRLFLSEVNPDTHTAKKKLVGRVRMSHEQAWLFVKMLDQLLDQYVRKVGPLRIPDDLIDRHGFRAEYEAMLERSKR